MNSILLFFSLVILSVNCNDKHKLLREEGEKFATDLKDFVNSMSDSETKYLKGYFQELRDYIGRAQSLINQMDYREPVKSYVNNASSSSIILQDASKWIGIRQDLVLEDRVREKLNLIQTDLNAAVVNLDNIVEDMTTGGPVDIMRAVLDRESVVNTNDAVKKINELIESL